MPGKMTNLIVNETSGVDHPAHLHEGFLVMKAADRNRAEVVVSAFGKKESPVTAARPTAVTTAEDIKKAIDSALQPILDQFAEGWKALRDYAEKSDDDVPTPEGTDPADADAVLAAQAQNDLALSADMLKSAPEAVVKAIEAQRAELAKAREDIAKERDIRLDMEAVSFAKATYPNLNLPDETVKAIRRAGVVDPALGESLKALLVSSNAMLDGAPLLGELGSAAPIDKAASTAAEQVEQKAAALVAEGKFDTIQKAKAHVYDAEPELAERVKEEAR